MRRVRRADHLAGSFHRRCRQIIEPRPVNRSAITNALPIVFVKPGPHTPLERRIGPRMWTRCYAVFDGIVMDVIAVTREVRIVSNDMFPKPALPYASAAIPSTRVRGCLLLPSLR